MSDCSPHVRREVRRVQATTSCARSSTSNRRDLTLVSSTLSVTTLNDLEAGETASSDSVLEGAGARHGSRSAADEGAMRWSVVRSREGPPLPGGVSGSNDGPNYCSGSPFVEAGGGSRLSDSARRRAVVFSSSRLWRPYAMRTAYSVATLARR